MAASASVKNLTATRRGFVAAAAGAAAGVAVLGGQPAAARAAEQVWDYEADVVVVGGGCAGLMAASAAAEQGASVVLVEKMGACGGDTAVSGQTIQGCWPARAKRDFGVDDSLDSYFEDWKKSHPNTTKGRRGEPLPEEFPFTQRQLSLMVEVYEWLEEAGVEWVTNDRAPQAIYPQPAWDTVFPRSWSAASPLIPTMQEKAEELGVQIVCDMQAVDVLQDEAGRVTGVLAFSTAGERTTFLAKRAVILASGSFCGNRAMLKTYLHGQVHSVCPLTGGFGSTGDAMTMALKAGGHLEEMDLGSHWIPLEALTDSMIWFALIAPFGGPEGQMDRGDVPCVLINYQGKRFMSETDGYKWVGKGVAEQDYHEAWVVLDSSEPDVVDALKATESNELFLLEADSLEGLAERMQVPVDAMLAEIETYNGYVDAGDDPEYGRHMENVPRIENGPFYAFRLRPRPYTTYGGIATDVDSHVVDADGNPIDGLYAAGTCTVCFSESEGLYYIGGIAQGTAFGRQAGKLAAAETPWC